MAATNSEAVTGRKNYYSVSYGKLSTKVKEIPTGFTEIVEADLKAKIQAVEQVDLRNKYINKGNGDYPYQVFYDSLTGSIVSQERFENDNGINLNLTVIDSDGDTSIVQSKFYSKYTENLLNRLLNTIPNSQYTFTPYQMPTTAEIEGKNKSFYNQGVSLKVNGNKVEPKYNKDSVGYPATEQVKVQGKATTSRDKRLDFLYDEFTKWFIPSQNTSPQQPDKIDESKPFIPTPVDSSQLPF